MGLIKEIEYICMEQDYFPECQESCEEFKKRGATACNDSRGFEEYWSGGDPCPTCGRHDRLTIFLDGKKEFEPCCEEERQ